ncbi:MAG: glucokinase [Flavobacteriaceae bacterium]|jgi:glucokinase|nr:glucokinase [Flavobacteriaceae bacterium]
MNFVFNFPLYSPSKNESADAKFNFLAADLKSEKSMLAHYRREGENLEILGEQGYYTKNFTSLSEMVRHFMRENNIESFEKFVIAVPGPVIKGICKTPNLPWLLNSENLKSALEIPKVYLINDLEAMSYSFTQLGSDKFEILVTSDDKVRGNVAILAPGSGLGEAGMFWNGEYLHPFATEGGHTEFSPRNDLEVEFYHFLNKIYGIVSWENVLSKKGIYNIYRFLRDVGRHQEDPWLAEKIQNEDFVNVIQEVGHEKKSRLVNLTIEMYGEFLAREANNLVLKLKAIGALIITGEIPAKIFELINNEKFYKDFKISDRMEHLLKDIPIYIIRNEKGIIEGAAQYGAFIE